MRRKFLSVVLCVCMMLTMAPFAFAEGETGIGETEIVTTNPPSSDSGSGAVTPTAGITTENALKDAISTASDNAIIKLGSDITLTSTLNITKNITLNGDGHTISGSVASGTSFINVSIPNDGDFTLTNCKIVPTTQVTPNAAISLSVAGKVTVTDCTFGASNDTAGHMYNGLEFSQTVPMGDTTITGNTFYGGAFRHNCISFYKMNDNATIDISNNIFSDLNWDTTNAVRVSNYGSNTAIINLNGNTYSDHGTTGANQSYAGLLVFQKTASNNDNFTKLTVNINKFSTTSDSQLLYVYDDNDGLITTNQPIVKGDSTVSKFFSAKIDDNLYTSLQAAISAASDGQTVTLLKNTTESVVIPANRTVNFDLNGNKLTAPTDKRYDAIVNYGTLTINDSKKTGEIISNKNSGIGIGANSNTTIVYAKITGQEGAIGGYKNTVGATLTIKDGIFNGIDNAVVIFNGSERTGNANTITINGGTFNGTIQSSGYVACGIYAPWQDNITVNGGTFNITNGAGIVARAGNVTVTDGEFNTTGNTTGRVGDSRVVVPCSALVFDSGANYPALTDSSKLTINGGKFKSDANNIAVVIPDAGDTNTRVEVTKGYFTSDPTPYCAENLTGVASDLNGYAYMVGNATTNTDKASTDSTTVKANVATNIPQGKEELVNNAAGQMTDGAAIDGKNLEAVVKSEADKNNITKTAAVTIYNNNKTDNADKLTADNVAIVYQSYIDVTVSDVEKTGDTYSQLSLELIPMYRVVATKQDNVTSDATLVTEGDGQNAVVIQAGQPLNNVPVNNYKVKLALPSGFASKDAKLSIKHTKGNGSVEYYTGTVSTEGEEGSAKTYVTFTTNGFSPFVIYAASANVASIGEGENQKVYPTLQAAIDAVQDGQTIKLTKACAENVTVSRNVKFTLNNGGKSFTGAISAGSRYNMTTADKQGNTEYTFTYVGGSSSGSISTPTSYNVNVNAATNGAVAADKKTASKGTTVTVTASPSKGYVVDAVKVVDKDGKDVAVTGKDGKYVFTMPASAVTVTGSFKAETPAPVALPFTDVKSGSWFYDAVKYAYAQGLMTGTSATTFAPNGTMNRAMIVTVLYRLEKSPAVTGASKFTDVPAGQWYSDAVAWAAANKIVNGYDETTFGPMNAVTREQMAAILFRYEQVKGLENVTLEENLNRFPDQNKISAYAIPALQWAVGQKIINGNADGTLDPTGTATRAQVAQIFTNLLNK